MDRASPAVRDPSYGADTPPDAEFANEALWLTRKRGVLRLGPADVPTPGPHDLTVRNHAIALNPVDHLLPRIGDLIAPWLRYPAVPGSDVAGVVVATGSAVTRFRVGDRVLGHAAGLERSRNRPAEGAFQRVTVLAEHMAAPIPAEIGFTDAVVLPLGLSTAATALFAPDHLALRPPVASPPPGRDTVLVWGASTSVGSNAVQLASAAGYRVVATASRRNFDFVQSLGAAVVCDYRGSSAVTDMIRAVGDRRLAGTLAIGIGSGAPCVAVAARTRGSRRVATVSPPVSFDAAPTGFRRTFWLVPTLARLGAANAALALRARRGHVRTRFVWGGALVEDAVGPMIYADYLPDALQSGRHRSAPPPLVVGHGLDAIPAALDRLRAGVSARKLVVTL